MQSRIQRAINEASGFSPRNFAVGESGTLSNGSVIAVIDEANMVVQCDGTPVWIKGMKTDGLAEGRRLPDSDFKVTGTRKYQSRLGERTVYVLEPTHIERPITHGEARAKDPKAYAEWLEYAQARAAKRQGYLGFEAWKTKKAEGAKAKPQTTVSEEDRAAAKLRLALKLIEAGKAEAGRERLAEITRDFSGTIAAEQARHELDK
jgi:hypothetical protein